MTIIVRGTPAPQGSKRHVGNGVMLESSKKLRPWRDAVRGDAAAACAGVMANRYGGRHPWQPLDGPLEVEMVFSFLRPAGHYGTGRNAHLVRAAAPDRPAGTPDLSKLARATEDALTDAGVWRDDARVVEYRRLAKVYAGDLDDPDALECSGVVIRIYTEEPA